MLEPPSPFALLAGLGMLVVGLVAVVGWQRRTKVAPAYFWLGALAWAVDVALRLASAKADAPVAALLRTHGARPALDLYLGVVRGLAAVVPLWFFAKRSRVRTAQPSETVAYGIGFGAVEAVLLGAYSIFGIVLALTSWNELAPPVRFQAAQLAGPLRLGLPALERAVAIAMHVVTAVLVVGAVQGRGESRRLWLLLAVVFEVSAAALAAWAFDHFAARTDAGYVKQELLVLGYTAVWAGITAGLVRRARRP